MLIRRVAVVVRRVVLPLTLLAGAAALAAQTPLALSALRVPAQANRVPANADFTARVQLSGHLPAWVHAASQSAKSFSLAEPMHVTVHLRRDPAVQAAFEQMLSDQQDPSSPLFHKWLTPEQIGALYGPTDADLAAVKQWLAAEGLTVDSVQPNKLFVEVSGSATQVAAALRTSFGMYQINGEERYAANAEPSIPVALAAVVKDIAGLSEAHFAPTLHSHAGVLHTLQSSGGVQPNATLSDGSHLLMPADFNTIYDSAQVLAAGNTGATIGSTRQRIGIVARSQVDPRDVSAFATFLGVPVVQPTVVLAGTDPGLPGTSGNSKLAGNQDEATLDVNRVQATAPGAQADLVAAASTSTQDGVYIASAYNVNTLRDPVMSVSFGLCESSAGPATFSIYSDLFAAGAAEGISIFVSSGDSGADGCFGPGSAATAGTPSVNVLCNQYTTCVGGTEFTDTVSPSLYWSSTNSTGYRSAFGYIPEGAWNEPYEAATSSTAAAYVMSASGGGASTFASKPGWQAGTGVPADGMRDTPDVAFSASSHDGYFACLTYLGATCVSTPQGLPFVYFNGTSAAAPSMAGIAALLNTRLGSAQGLVSPMLYRLAASAPAAFHDITVASSGVSGCTGGIASTCNNSTPSTGSLTAGVTGFVVGTGYDQVTGLGSLDVAAFLSAAAGVSQPFSVTAANPPTISSGATTNNTVAVTVSGQNSFSGTVNLTCSLTASSGAPAYPASCTVSPATVTVSATGSATATVTIASTAPVTQVASSPVRLGSIGLLWAALLALFPGTRRRNLRWLAVMVLSVAAAGAVTGCGGGSGSASQVHTTTSSAGTYVLRVTGVSGNYTETSSVNVVIQ